ncbi:MAG: hypothetical protein SGPRY_003356 [Prymnesium sp.]
MESSEDDEPEAIIGWGSARRQSARTNVATSRSARQAKKAEEERKSSLVTADLRGSDYFPPELLSHLPPTRQEPEGRGGREQPAVPHPKKRKGTPAPRNPRRREGLPQVVRAEHNIDIAVLPKSGMIPLAQAPVKKGLDDFLQKALYSGKKRVHATTMASLKPCRGKFGPAVDFATAEPSLAPPLERRRGGKRAKRGQNEQAKTSSLERMAAQIMQRKSSRV